MFDWSLMNVLKSESVKRGKLFWTLQIVLKPFISWKTVYYDCDVKCKDKRMRVNRALFK